LARSLEWAVVKGILSSPFFAKNENIIVKTVLEVESFEEHFHLPMSEIAFDQYCELSVNIQNLPDGEEDDRWSFIWGNGLYSVNKAYQHLIGDDCIHPAFK
jgi:hypothetical protein